MEKGKRFRKFFSRMNRGVALGLALVIITITYGAVSCSNFEKKELPRIDALVRGYVEEIFGLAEPMKNLKIGTELDDAAKKDLEAKAEALVAKYYSSSDAAVRTYGRNNYGGADFLIQMKNAASSAKAYRIRNITPLEPRYEYLSEVYGELLAGRYAEIRFDLRYRIEIDSDPLIKFLMIDGAGEYGSDGAATRLVDVEVNGTLYLIKENGEWLIASCTDLTMYLENIISEQPIKEVE